MRARSLHATSLGSRAELPRNELIAALTPAEARALLYEWAFWARPNQLPPNGEWRVWLVLAGRGFGKTRTGAEMIRARVTARTANRLALVAPMPAMSWSKEKAASWQSRRLGSGHDMSRRSGV